MPSEQGRGEGNGPLDSDGGPADGELYKGGVCGCANVDILDVKRRSELPPSTVERV